MTDRINYIVVGLKKDTRTDDIEGITAAIRMIRGVLTVEPHVSQYGDVLAEERARRELVDKIWDVLRPKT